MRCTVTKLRRNGVALARKDWPEPIEGVIQQGDQPQRDKPTSRVLFLHVPQGTTVRGAGALIEPQWHATTEDGFILRGIERHHEDGIMVACEQLWLIRPLGPLRSTLPLEP